MFLVASIILLAVGISLLAMKDDLCKDYETKHKKNIEKAGKALSIIGCIFTACISFMMYRGRGAAANNYNV